MIRHRTGLRKLCRCVRIASAVAAAAALSAVGEERAGDYFHAGMIHRENAEYGQAIESFKQAAALDPVWACAYNNMGYCQMKIGQFDEAEASFSKAIELVCDHVDRAYYNRAKVYLHQRRYSEALEDADIAVGLMKEEIPHRYFLRGKIYYFLNEFRSAERDLSEAYALDPQLYAALLYRAKTFWKLKDYKKASADVVQIHSHAGSLKFSGFPMYFLGAWVMFPSIVVLKLRFSAWWVRITRKQCEYMIRCRLMTRKQAERLIRFETRPCSTYIYVIIAVVLIGIALPLFYLPLYI